MFIKHQVKSCSGGKQEQYYTNVFLKVNLNSGLFCRSFSFVSFEDFVWP